MGQLLRKIEKLAHQISNMISGVLLRLHNPFKKGDFIEINGQLGSVEHKGYKDTTIKNIQGEEIRIANTSFYIHQLHNLTTHNIVDVDCTVSVEIQSNMMQVKELIRDFSLDYPTTLNSPSTKIFVKKIKESHVELRVRVWCHIEKHLEVDSEYQELLQQHLIKNGVCLEELEITEYERMTA